MAEVSSYESKLTSKGLYKPDISWGLWLAGIAAVFCFCMISGIILTGYFLGLFGFFAWLVMTLIPPLKALHDAFVNFLLLLAVSYAVQVAGGIMMTKGKKISFFLVGIPAVIRLFFCLGHLQQLICEVAFDVCAIYYCAMRIAQKEGPPLVD